MPGGRCTAEDARLDLLLRYCSYVASRDSFLTSKDLAAFANADDKRRENYEELMRGLTFPRRESETPAFDGPGEGISATPVDSDFLVSRVSGASIDFSSSLVT
jgi:hypothetical protein